MSDENEIPDNTKKTSPLAVVGIILAIIIAIWRLSHLHDPPPPDTMQITMPSKAEMDSMVAFHQQMMSSYHMNLLMNKSPEEVAKILGDPGQVVKHPRNMGVAKGTLSEIHYHGDSVAVVYRNGQAKWFDLDHMEQFTYAGKEGVLNLPHMEPDFVDEDRESYRHYPGIRELTFIPNHNGAAKTIKEIIIDVE